MKAVSSGVAAVSGSSRSVSSIAVQLTQSQLQHSTLWSFAAKHPLVSLRINSSDARADLTEDSDDLALRLGALPPKREKT